MSKVTASAAFKNAITQPNIAFLIGNGVNLAEMGHQGISWKILLEKLADKRQISLPSKFDETMSMTEIADILRLSDIEKNELKNDLIQLLSPGVKYTPAIAKFAHENKIPILTTNYDFNLSNPCLKASRKARKLSKKKRPKFIPIGWDTYRGTPASEEFARNAAGLWHVHGSLDLKNSLKLTSANYVVSTKSAHDLIHHHGLYANLRCDIRECSGCKECAWGGKGTWLDIFFHKRLVVVGFGFGPSETFLRSLSIERAKYLKHRYGDLNQIPKSYFVYNGKTSMGVGQRFFFEQLGFEIININQASNPFDKQLFVKGGTQ